MEFTFMPGTDGVTFADVAHVLVPGKGRTADGFGLSTESLDRVAVARALHERLPAGVGRIVCSGYKSPADSGGSPWSPDASGGETFRGMPEADLMKDELVRQGVAEHLVGVERHSVDTVTNLLRCEHEGHFGDRRPVAIVAQAHHLRRILRVIAPRTLRRPYLGVVVPGGPDRPEGRLTVLASRLTIAMLPADADRAVDVAARRAEVLWRLAALARLGPAATMPER